MCGGLPQSTPWVVEMLETAIGPVPRISTKLTRTDLWGKIKVRLNIGRMRYLVQPGLYAVGYPNAESHVLVTANYKLSFDTLRRELAGQNLWILVLNTDGINVWCAAGKGTFGTAEIVRQVQETRLADLVIHRELIVPQLGAPGVSAHLVKRLSGFKVTYGPIQAAHLVAFLANSKQANRQMRTVQFDLRARLAVVPLELVMWLRYTLIAAAILILLSCFSDHAFQLSRIISHGPGIALNIGLAFFSGIILTPILLPLIPSRAFALKGFLVGLVLAAGTLIFRDAPLTTAESQLSTAAWLLIIPAASSFFAMNYTGASTYTSLSGVKAEMKIALPAQTVAGFAGLALWLIGAGLRMFGS